MTDLLELSKILGPLAPTAAVLFLLWKLGLIGKRDSDGEADETTTYLTSISEELEGVKGAVDRIAQETGDLHKWHEREDRKILNDIAESQRVIVRLLERLIDRIPPNPPAIM